MPSTVLEGGVGSNLSPFMDQPKGRSTARPYLPATLTPRRPLQLVCKYHAGREVDQGELINRRHTARPFCHVINVHRDNCHMLGSFCAHFGVLGFWVLISKRY